MTVIGVIALVVAYIVTHWILGAPGYDLLMNKRIDDTAEIVDKLRQRTGNYHSFIDIFEKGVSGMVFTNVGIIADYGNLYIPYEEITSISEPDFYVDDKGKKHLNARQCNVTAGGNVYKIHYLNWKGNCFGAMVHNISKSGYPIPKYEGYRGRL